jgi:hypothetical protein
MMTPTSGWLVYRIIDGSKAQVIGIYDQYEKASNDIQVLGRAMSEGWQIVGAPFVGWDGTNTSHRTERTFSTPAVEQGAGKQG